MLVSGGVNLGFTLPRIRHSTSSLYLQYKIKNTNTHALYIYIYMIHENRGLEPYAFCIISIANLQSNTRLQSEFECRPGQDQDVTAEQLLNMYISMNIYIYIYLYFLHFFTCIQAVLTPKSTQHPRGKLKDRFVEEKYIPSRSLTVRPWKYTIPIGKACLPPTIFQGLCETSTGYCTCVSSDFRIP